MLSLAADVPLLHGLASGISCYGNNANAFLELQWYMFTGMVLLGGPYTLKMSEHVRPFYGMASARARIWIDICRSVSSSSISRGRGSSSHTSAASSSNNAGGLLRWPVKPILPIGFALMVLQGRGRRRNLPGPIAEFRPLAQSFH